MAGIIGIILILAVISIVWITVTIMKKKDKE